MYIILYINYTSLKKREICQLVMADHYEADLRGSWMKKLRLEKLKFSGSGPILAQIWLVHFAAQKKEKKKRQKPFCYNV